MKQLYILILNLFLSFKVYKYILFLYYAFIILKIIDALIKINIVHINYGTYVA